MDPAESDPDSDAAVDALLEEFGGDPRMAILALMHDIDVLARDFEASVSRGYVRHDKAIARLVIRPTLPLSASLDESRSPDSPGGARRGSRGS